MSDLVAHQAIFGEVDLGHNLICTSGIQDKQLLNELTYKYTDRHPNFEWCGLTQYTRSDVVGNYYVLSKIALDPNSRRAGMVLTHSLVFELNALSHWNNLIQIIRGLPDLPERKNKIGTITFSEESVQVNRPNGYSKLVNILFSRGGNDSPMIWVGETGFFEALHHLWTNVWPNARRRITFNASSGPTDVSGNPFLLLVSENCTNKWYGQEFIRSADYVAPTTLGERILLGDQDGSLLWQLQHQLEIETMRLNDLTILQLAYQTIEVLDESPSLTKAAQLTRLITALAPNMNSGTLFKSQRLTQLCELVSTAPISELLVLRNVKLTAFGDSSTCLVPTIVSRLNEHFIHATSELVKDFVAIIQSSDPENEAFWNQAIDEFLQIFLQKQWSSAVAKFTWDIWLESVITVQQLDAYLGSTDLVEAGLIETCPPKLSKARGEEVASLAAKHNWYRLHAVILSRFCEFEDALARQLVVDYDSQHFSGLEELVAQYRTVIPTRSLVISLLQTQDIRIPAILGTIGASSPEFLLELEPREKFIYEVWLHALAKNSQLFETLFIPSEFLNSFLDGVCDGNEQALKIAEYLSISRYKDVLGYTRRSQLWGSLPHTARQPFLDATAVEWLDELIQGGLSDANLIVEQPLQEAIAKSAYLRELLASNWEETSSLAVRIFSHLHTVLGEYNFIQWFLVPQLKNNIPVQEAKVVGRFVIQKGWKDAAAEIYKQVKMYDEHTPWRVALDEVDVLIPAEKHWLKDIESTIKSWWYRPEINGTSKKRNQKLKVLVILADPKNQPPLLLSEEAKRIDDATRMSRYFSHPNTLLKPRIGDLHARLQNYKPHIVHFAGHGSQAGELIFEDQFGKALAAPPEALAELFALLKKNIRCVVLNACYSETQAQAISSEIDYVIGMSNRIKDDAAISFSSSFYQSLASEENYELAFKLGCNSLRLHNIPGADIPVLLGKKTT